MVKPPACSPSYCTFVSLIPSVIRLQRHKRLDVPLIFFNLFEAILQVDAGGFPGGIVALFLTIVKISKRSKLIALVIFHWGLKLH